MRTLYEVEIEEKRHSRRFACELETRVSLLPQVEATEQSKLLQGVTENISPGGIALSTHEFVPVDSIVRCEFSVLSGSEIRIPSLLKVRWSEKLEATGQYKLGLQFLL